MQDLAQWALENFREIGLAGAGAHGIVFRCVCTHTGATRALKFVARTDASGTVLAEASLTAENEMRINAMLCATPPLRASLAPFPWMTAAAEGTINLFEFMDVRNRHRLDPRLHGTAAFTVIVMHAAECTLTEFLARYDSDLARRSQIADACVLLVLLQLCALKLHVPGFQHRDVKPDNILMWPHAHGTPPPPRYRVTENHLVCVPLTATDHFSPSLSDFGLAVVDASTESPIDADFLTLLLTLQGVLGAATKAEFTEQLESIGRGGGSARSCIQLITQMQCFHSYVTSSPT